LRKELRKSKTRAREGRPVRSLWVLALRMGEKVVETYHSPTLAHHSSERGRRNTKRTDFSAGWRKKFLSFSPFSSVRR
jgi:hypothetical protein